MSSVPWTDADQNVLNPQYNQVKHYELLDQLQKLVIKLPIKVQQRLPYDLLANLASSLQDSTIFTIVNDLEEIQHLTEKNLFAQRQKICAQQKQMKNELKRKHTDEISICKAHNLNIVKVRHEKETKDLENRAEQELKQFDSRCLLEIDQKVVVQQATLKSAGVPGFFVTENHQEIKLQMIILDLIKSLGSMSQWCLDWFA